MLVWLKGFRDGTGMSQSAFAKKIGISQQYYNFIESGKRQPPIKTAKKIAGALGFDWRLFYEEGEGSEQRRVNNEQREGCYDYN